LSIQLGWATSDNAANNNMTMKALGEQLVAIDPKTGKEDHWYAGSSMRVQYIWIFFFLAEK